MTSPGAGRHNPPGPATILYVLTIGEQAAPPHLSHSVNRPSLV